MTCGVELPRGPTLASGSVGGRASVRLSLTRVSIVTLFACLRTPMAQARADDTRFLVALSPARDLLLCANHLFIAAMVAIAAAGGSRMSNGTSSALNSEQDLDSIPTAQGGLSRLAIARLQSAGVIVPANCVGHYLPE